MIWKELSRNFLISRSTSSSLLFLSCASSLYRHFDLPAIKELCPLPPLLLLPMKLSDCQQLMETKRMLPSNWARYAGLKRRYLLQGRNDKFISRGCFCPVLFVPSFPPFFHRRKVAPQIQLRELVSLVSCIASPAKEKVICSHPSRFLGSKFTKTHFWCIYSPRNVSGCCKCCSISVKPCQKIEANVTMQ